MEYLPKIENKAKINTSPNQSNWLNDSVQPQSKALCYIRNINHNKAKKRKGILIGKEEIKLSLFTNIITYVHNPKQTT